MPKGLLWALVIVLCVMVAAYTLLKVLHVDGSETLAVAMTGLITVFVAIQNAALSKELEKVKRQTNGMTHHIMKESEHLRRAKTLVEPMDIVEDTDDRPKQTRPRGDFDSWSGHFPRGISPGGKHSSRDTGSNGDADG